LRRMRRRNQLRVRETKHGVVIALNSPGGEVEGVADLAMKLQSGLKIRLGSSPDFEQSRHRAMNFGHGYMAADNGEIVEF
jgi:hypothetical protein